MTLSEILNRVEDSDMEQEAKAELSAIVAAWQRIKKEPWHNEDCECRCCNKEGKEMKHTLGPWNTQIAQPYEDFKFEVTYDTEDGLTYPITDVYSEEDAQPIAAVPELLEACKAMTEYISQQWEDDWENRPNHLRLGEQAIALAEPTTKR